MKYTYSDIKDKSIDGIKNELSDGLSIIAFHFKTVLGIPLDEFEEMISDNCPTVAHQLSFYMDFRNKNTELFS